VVKEGMVLELLCGHTGVLMAGEEILEFSISYKEGVFIVEHRDIFTGVQMVHIRYRDEDRFYADS
jgi:hypothetical protein